MEQDLVTALRTHLIGRAKVSPPETGLLTAIAWGSLALVPPTLRWSDSAKIAHLINGYDLAHEAGIGDLIDFCNQRREAAEASGWSGNLLELWLCIFGEHRRARHGGGYPVEDNEKVLLDRLCAAFAAACAAALGPSSTVRHREWTDECANLLEHFLWEPQHLGHKKREPSSGRSLPPSEVVRRVMRQEVPLNHQINLFFQLAPAEMSQRWFESRLSKTDATCPTLLYSRDLATSVCQPDMCFQAARARLFIELKINAKAQSDQVLRYAALTAKLDREAVSQPWALVLLGPDRERFAEVMQFAAEPLSYQPPDRILRQCDEMQITLELVTDALRRMEVATASFADFDRFLRREDQQLDRSSRSEGDQTLRRLIRGMRAFLQPLVG